MFWPSKNHKRKRLVLDLLSLQQDKKFSHIVLRIPHTNDPVSILIDSLTLTNNIDIELIFLLYELFEFD